MLDMKDKLIQKQKELIHVQGMLISYFKKYSGESERIQRFSELIIKNQSEIDVLEKAIKDEEKPEWAKPKHTLKPIENERNMPDLRTDSETKYTEVTLDEFIKFGAYLNKLYNISFFNEDLIEEYLKSQQCG